jgi:hypothetical protein
MSAGLKGMKSESHRKRGGGESKEGPKEGEESKEEERQ